MNLGTEPKAPLLLLHVVTGVSPLHTLCYLYSTLCYLYSFFDNQEREAATRASKALAGGGGGCLCILLLCSLHVVGAKQDAIK